MNIGEVIKEAICRDGPMPFDRFMEMALYYPDLGYYSSERNPVGTAGDYYTMPHLTPAFGAMIARQLKEMWEIIGQPETFMVVEVGAGNGHLCRSILQYARTTKEFGRALHYCIVERSATMRIRAKQIVSTSVDFFESVDALPNFTGCVLSNELFDNIPFSILVRQKEMMEVFVDYNGGFLETFRPVSSILQHLVTALGVDIPDEGRTEISLQSMDYFKQVSEKLDKGYFLTIDYGYIRHRFQNGMNSLNTLACYRSHQTNYNPYVHVGEQDITCSIDFTALCQYGKSLGIEPAGYISQANFLRSLGLVAYLEEIVTDNPNQLQMARFIIDLLINQHGNRFKVLIQYKGIGYPSLTGLQLREQGMPF